MGTPYRADSDVWPTRYCGRHHHALERAWQRLGLKLFPRDLEELEEALRSRKFHFVGWDRHGRQVWDVEIEGREAFVIYNPDSGHIATFLPLHYEVYEMGTDLRRVQGKPKSFFRRLRQERDVRGCERRRIRAQHREWESWREKRQRE